MRRISIVHWRESAMFLKFLRFTANKKQLPLKQERLQDDFWPYKVLKYFGPAIFYLNDAYEINYMWTADMKSNEEWSQLRGSFFIWFHIRSSHMIYFICIIHLHIFHGNIWTHNWPAPNVSGFIAQLVERRTGIREVTGSSPVEVLNFFQASLRIWYSICQYAVIFFDIHRCQRCTRIVQRNTLCSLFLRVAKLVRGRRWNYLEWYRNSGRLFAWTIFSMLLFTSWRFVRSALCFVSTDRQFPQMCVKSISTLHCKDSNSSLTLKLLPLRPSTRFFICIFYDT